MFTPTISLNVMPMKNNCASLKRFPGALLAALLLGTGAASSQAALAFPPSPVFSNAVPAWDCLITGERGERGIGLLTFSYAPDGYGNYTFDLRQIHTKVPTSTPKVKVTVTNTPADSGRGSTGNRGDVTPVIDPVIVGNLADAANTKPVTNIFGYIRPQGSWGFDYKGRILGFYVELLLVKPGEGTNPPTYITNQVSFIGKVTPNKRFTAIYSSTVGGNGKYSGVPLKTVTNQINGADFSGPWTAEEISGPVDTVELFTLFPDSGGFPNAYDIVGEGPAYSLDYPGGGAPPAITSKCLVSCQKKFAFTDYKFVNSTNPVYYLRATYGDLKNNASILGGSTKGLSQGSNVVYNAFFVPFVPYP